jgi:hypothetical protein
MTDGAGDAVVDDATRGSGGSITDPFDHPLHNRLPSVYRDVAAPSG